MMSHYAELYAAYPFYGFAFYYGKVCFGMAASRCITER